MPYSVKDAHFDKNLAVASFSIDVKATWHVFCISLKLVGIDRREDRGQRQMEADNHLTG